MQDAWRAYLELALGVTEASRKKAAQVVRSLAEQSGAKVEDLQGMTEELLSAGLANREGLIKLIRFELDRTLGKIGLATSEEVDDLKDKIRDLELRLREAKEQAAAAEEVAEQARTEQSTPTTTPAKAAAKKSTPKKVAKKTAKKASAAKSTTAKKTTAKKTTKKATVKKTVKKAAKKSTGGGTA